MKAFYIAMTIFVAGIYALAQHAPAAGPHAASGGMEMHDHHAHENDPSAAISYTELKNTADQLDRVQQATAKYRDVKAAQADGYQERGVEIQGMGIHFVREMEPNEFHVEKPSMLVYEKDSSAPDGLSLVGVVYLLKGAEGPDGQPVNNPFPRPLAVWHHHSNVCMLSESEHVTKLTEDECRQKGGHFNDIWMIHAWVWKDSPEGVFSPRNSLVATSAKKNALQAK